MAELPKDFTIRRPGFFFEEKRKDTMNVVQGDIDALEKGISLFNGGKYFDAHEAWESLWLGEHDADEKRFLQGLIMAAGSFQHYVRQECAGASALLAKSIPMIQAGVKAHPNLRVSEFVQALDGLKEDFDRCSYTVSAEVLPKIARMYVYC
jgi:predicted metal-dependent hydrolase